MLTYILQDSNSPCIHSLETSATYMYITTQCNGLHTTHQNELLSFKIGQIPLFCAQVTLTRQKHTSYCQHWKATKLAAWDGSLGASWCNCHELSASQNFDSPLVFAIAKAHPLGFLLLQHIQLLQLAVYLTLTGITLSQKLQQRIHASPLLGQNRKWSARRAGEIGMERGIQAEPRRPLPKQMLQ